MSDDKPTEDVDVTKEWRATHGQEFCRQAASHLRRDRRGSSPSAARSPGSSCSTGTIRPRNLPLLIGILVGIAIFAIAGSLMWKAANKQDPARESDKARFFFQNQLGAIITLIAFLPLIVLIFMDKDMDPKNKKIAGGVGVVLAMVATLIGVELSIRRRSSNIPRT